MGDKLRLACTVCTELLSAVRHQLHSRGLPGMPLLGRCLLLAHLCLCLAQQGRVYTIGRTQLFSLEPTCSLNQTLEQLWGAAPCCLHLYGLDESAA